MYFTDRGIEELADRRGEEQVTVAWLAERLRDFVDLNPDFETAVDRLATWLARLDDEEDPFKTLSAERTGARAPRTALAHRRVADSTGTMAHRAGYNRLSGPSSPVRRERLRCGEVGRWGREFGTRYVLTLGGCDISLGVTAERMGRTGGWRTGPSRLRRAWTLRT